MVLGSVSFPSRSLSHTALKILATTRAVLAEQQEEAEQEGLNQKLGTPFFPVVLPSS